MSRSSERGRVRPIVILLAAVLLAAIGGAVVAPRLMDRADPEPSADAERTWTFVVQTRCADSEFSCVTLRVPRDHFAEPGGETIEVTFGLLRATQPTPDGVFVTATGGPGSSGLAVADSYTSVFDARLRETHDIVFFDQRGIGMSAPLACPDAVLDFYASPDVPTLSEEALAAYAAASRTFSVSCAAEMEIHPEALATFGTRQAVEDLEAFRQWLGADRMHLYGESYGSQLVQSYAAAHPDRVASLMLDGPVDLTLEAEEYYVEQAQAFEDALLHTLAACEADALCADDVGGEASALEVWDGLAERLRDAPVAFGFVTADGSTVERELTYADLEAATAAHLYSTYDQRLLLRALAHAARDELLPLARLTYLALGQDPETLGPVEDPSYSDAMYYAVECLDYAFPGESTAEREAAFFQAGEEAGVAAVRMGSIFYGDLPCASWPARAESSDRPEPLTDTAFPIFVLASTTDPATPYVGALRIHERAADGYLITQPGGPHVIFGRGEPCVDEPITEFLVDGTRPDEREIECEAVGPDAYRAIPPALASSDLDPLAAMTALDDEITLSPDFWYWDGVDPLAVGCLQGGLMTYEATDVGYLVTLDACAAIEGLPASGMAEIDDEAGTLRLDVDAGAGTALEYRRDENGERSAEGTWFGRPVDEDG